MNFHPFLSLGIIFLTGLAAAGFLRRFRMPAVTSYLILGIACGPYFLDIISAELLKGAGTLSALVLSLIAFSIGQNFSRKRLREIGKPVIFISLTQSLGAALATGAAVYLAGGGTFYALVFAAIAPATAPAAIVMVTRELKAKGKFTDTLLGIVAFDDVWGLIIFALVTAAARGTESITGGLAHGLFEVGGAVILGILLGIIFIKFSKFTFNSSAMLIYTLGFILLTSGISLLLDLSVLLSNMALSAVITNSDTENLKFFDIIRKMDSPFYLLFFVLAGASLEIRLINTMGILGGVYIAARMAGKISGTWIGCAFLRTPKIYSKYLGIGLAPQAGVALGMAMIISKHFPDEGGFVLSVIIATTVIYEIFGPLLTRLALVKSGETSEAYSDTNI